MPHRARVLITGAALLLSACCCPARPRGPASEGVTARTGTTAGFEWAILPAETGTDLFVEVSRGWRPDAITVRRALRGVRGHVAVQLERTWPPEVLDTEGWHETLRGVLAKLSVYRCQAIGYSDGGRRLIRLNFVHRQSFDPHPDDEPDDLEDWTVEPHFVDDGGDWYWQVVYDPAKRAFFGLTVNGEA